MPGGAFRLSLGNWANLNFEIDNIPENQPPWEIGNVCRDNGSTDRFPIFWPQTIEDNFQVLALRAILAIMDSYVASGELAEDIQASAQPSTV
ncbi:MAG: hypothetical protein DI537_10065 [Stutzerimonas stutzeri]|nr:MAG: hypothetical protein DI537_10065 [Stutzerimonas stutzeri]